LPQLAEAGWDVWERLAALEPADTAKGLNEGAGQLEPRLIGMTAVVEQRSRLQVHKTGLLSLLPWLGALFYSVHCHVKTLLVSKVFA
jgi:hypothetical protein